MKQSTGTHASGPTPQHGQLRDELAAARLDAQTSPPRLRALSTGVARHLKSYHGGGPPKAASVRFYAGYLVTVLDVRLTRADPSRPGQARAPLVGEPRCRFEEAIAAERVRAAEQALGRRVLAHRTHVIPESGSRIEIFELAGPPERGSGLQVLGVGRS